MKGNHKLSKQSFFRTLVARAPEAITVIDADDRLFYANSACSALLGYAEQELLGRPWADFVFSGTEGEPPASLFSRAVDAGWQGELRLHPRNGQDLWAVVMAYPLSGEDKVALIIHDISACQEQIGKHERAERSLTHERELLDALMNYLPDWIFFKDVDSRIIRSSKTHAAVLGLEDPQAAIGKTDFDFFPPEDAQRFFAEEQELMHSGQPIIGRVGATPTPEGGISWRSETKILMRDEQGQVSGLVGISRDITSLKLAEEELQQHKERLEELVAARTAELQAQITERTRLERQAQESLARRVHQIQLSTEVAQEITALTDFEELLQRVVMLVKERFGYYHVQIFRHALQREVMLLLVGYGAAGEKMLAAGHSLAYGKGVVGTAALTGEPVLAADVRADPNWVPHPDLPATQGELAVPIKWRDEVLGILDVQSDIAGALMDEDQLLLQGLVVQIASSIESTRLLAAARDSRRRYRDLYDQSPDGYFSLNAEGTFVDINATGLSLFGYERAELVDKMRLPQLLIPADRAVFQREFPKIKREGRISNVEVTFQRHDGSTFRASVYAVAIYDEMGNFDRTQTIVRDITVLQAARLEREQALAESQTLYLVSQSLITQEDLQTMLQTVIEGVVEALGADRAIIITFDLATRRVRHYLKAGPGSGDLEETVPFEELWEGLSGWVLRQRQPTLSPKDVPDPRESVLVQTRRRKSGSGSIMVVPLLYRGELLGTLTAVRQLADPDFTARELDLLTTFAQQVSATVVNRRLLAQAEARAQREQLLREISTRVRSSIDVETIMRTAVRELGNALSRPAFVRLGSAEELSRTSSGVTEPELTLPEGGA
ncbi:MAG: PAS domain S-box protein [Chloroflexota bacterium]|nr:PAS domain S-box protein [Chloroflexota bacterium]